MGVMENHWRFSPGRRKALASLAGVFAASPLLKAQIDPHPLTGHKRIPSLAELVDAFDFEAICYRNMTYERYDYMAHGDGSEWNLRRNRQAFDWVDIVPGKSRRPGIGRHVVRDSRDQDAVSDFHRAELGSGRASSRWRDGHVPRRHRRKRARGVRQRHDDSAAENRVGGHRSALAAVLSNSRSGRFGQAAPDVSGFRREGDHHHRRSAGVVLRARPARPPPRRDREYRTRRRRRRWQRRGRCRRCRRDCPR